MNILLIESDKFGKIEVFNLKDEDLKFIKEKLGDKVRFISVGNNNPNKRKLYIFNPNILHYEVAERLGLRYKEEEEPNILYGVGEIKGSKLKYLHSVGVQMVQGHAKQTLQYLKLLIDMASTKHSLRLDLSEFKKEIKKDLQETPKNMIALLDRSHKRKLDNIINPL